MEVRLIMRIEYLQGRDGEIKHLYRNFAFLHSRMYLDNGGIFVCKTRHLQLAGGAKVSTAIVLHCTVKNCAVIIATSTYL